MSYHLNNEQRMNEIIFAGRNKSYGAYELRSSYGKTVFRSLGIVMLGSGTLFLIAYYLTRPEPEIKAASAFIIHDSVYVIKYNAEVELEKPKEKSAAASAARSTEEHTGRLVVTDSAETAVTNTVAINAGTTSIVSESVTTGDGPDTGSVRKVVKAGSPLGTGIKQGYEVDSEPEFEGGLKALYRFVAQNIRYPEIAAEAGKEGTVYVKFVVDETGKVGSLSVLNNLGYGLEEEALRVVAKIPKFKSPAKAGGEPVKVYFQLPIRYHLSK